MLVILGPTKRELKKSPLPAPDRSPPLAQLLSVPHRAARPLSPPAALLQPPSPFGLRRSPRSPFTGRFSPSAVHGSGASTREVARGVSSFVPSLSHSYIIDLARSSANSDLER